MRDLNAMAYMIIKGYTFISRIHFSYTRELNTVPRKLSSEMRKLNLFILIATIHVHTSILQNGIFITSSKVRIVIN